MLKCHFFPYLSLESVRVLQHTVCYLQLLLLPLLFSSVLDCLVDVFLLTASLLFRIIYYLCIPVLNCRSCYVL